MDPEEIRRRLKELGISSDGSWGTSKEGEFKSPIVEQQKANLLRLKLLLERQVEEDKLRVADLQAQLLRLKRGGGN